MLSAASLSWLSNLKDFYYERRLLSQGADVSIQESLNYGKIRNTEHFEFSFNSIKSYNYHVKMRSRTDNWFECKIRYEKTMDDGLQKKVTEAYVVDALSFTEAEKCILEEVSSYISGVFEVSDIKRAAYKEIFFSDAAADDRWYKAKLQFITTDEKTEKEKRSNVNFLVQAATLNSAVHNIVEAMSGSIIDYVIVSVAETALMDVFEYKKKEEEQDEPEYES